MKTSVLRYVCSVPLLCTLLREELCDAKQALEELRTKAMCKSTKLWVFFIAIAAITIRTTREKNTVEKRKSHAKLVEVLLNPEG